MMTMEERENKLFALNDKFIEYNRNLKRTTPKARVIQDTARLIFTATERLDRNCADTDDTDIHELFAKMANDADTLINRALQALKSKDRER